EEPCNQDPTDPPELAVFCDPEHPRPEPHAPLPRRPDLDGKAGPHPGFPLDRPDKRVPVGVGDEVGQHPPDGPGRGVNESLGPDFPDQNPARFRRGGGHALITIAPDGPEGRKGFLIPESSGSLLAAAGGKKLFPTKPLLWSDGYGSIGY